MKIQINDKEYIIPNSWDDITMKEYCHLFYKLPDSNEDPVQILKNESIIISRLLGESDDWAGNIPFEIYSRIRDSVKFIYEINNFLESKIFYLNIDGKKYFVPEVNEMSLRQYIDADMIMKEESENQFIELLACLLLPIGKDGKYEYDGKYQELIPKIERMKASDGLPFVYTFFKKKILSSNLSEAFSKVEAAADQYVKNIQNS